MNIKYDEKEVLILTDKINKNIYDEISLDSLLKDCETDYSIERYLEKKYSASVDGKNLASIFILGLLPYQSILSDGILAEGVLDHSDIKEVNDIFIKEKNCVKIIGKVRAKFKLYSEKSIQNNLNILKSIHSDWVELMNKDIFMTTDFGTFIISNEFIGNNILYSWYLNEFLSIKSIDSEQSAKDVKLFGESMGKILKFVCNKYSIQKKKAILNPKIQIKDKDFLLEQSKTIIFNNKYDKYVSILLFNILCSINFVLYFLGKIVRKNNEFYFRIKYNCCYYAISSLLKLANHSENNTIQTGVENHIPDKEKLEKLIASIGGSGLRNCMAHYKISKNDIKENEILRSVPFYGLIEKYTSKDYYSLNKEIEDNLKNISLLLGKWVLN